MPVLFYDRVIHGLDKERKCFKCLFGFNKLTMFKGSYKLSQILASTIACNNYN